MSSGKFRGRDELEKFWRDHETRFAELGADDWSVLQTGVDSALAAATSELDQKVYAVHAGNVERAEKVLFELADVAPTDAEVRETLGEMLEKEYRKQSQKQSQ